MSSTEVTRACLDQIAATDGEYHAFLHVAAEQALAAGGRVDAAVAAGEPLPSPLAGVPLALKDVFTTTDMPTTCGSKILEGWVSPYDATVTARLRAAGIPILGKTNMDEFAMGSSTENSAYGPDPQPVERRPGARRFGRRQRCGAGRVPGAAGHRLRHRRVDPSARGADRDGRREADLRHGVAVRADRLRLVAGPGRAVRAHRAGHRAAARGDRRARPARLDVGGRRGARRRRRGQGGRHRRPHGRAGRGGQAVAQRRGLPAGRAGVVQRRASTSSTALGAEVSEVDCPHFDYSLAAYYLILPSEVSSNLARFDAMRYGLRVGDDGTHSAEEVMALTRAAGFGPEVKRRIMIGTYALSAGYYDAYYNQAQKVRTLIARDLDEAYQKRRRAGVARDADHGVPRWGRRSTIRWRCTCSTCARCR